MYRIAIVEDDESDRRNLELCLNQASKNHNLDLKVDTYFDGLNFLSNYHNEYDILFFDINSPISTESMLQKKLWP